MYRLIRRAQESPASSEARPRRRPLLRARGQAGLRLVSPDGRRGSGIPRTSPRAAMNEGDPGHLPSRYTPRQECCDERRAQPTVPSLVATPCGPPGGWCAALTPTKGRAIGPRRPSVGNSSAWAVRRLLAPCCKGDALESGDNQPHHRRAPSRLPMRLGARRVKPLVVNALVPCGQPPLERFRLTRSETSSEVPVREAGACGCLDQRGGVCDASRRGLMIVTLEVDDDGVAEVAECTECMAAGPGPKTTPRPSAWASGLAPIPALWR